MEGLTINQDLKQNDDGTPLQGVRITIAIAADGTVLAVDTNGRVYKGMVMFTPVAPAAPVTFCSGPMGSTVWKDI